MAAKKSDPNELVRVRVPVTGHEISVRRSLADLFGLTVIAGKPAADRKGYPLPPKTNPLPKSSDAESEGAADQAADIPTA